MFRKILALVLSAPLALAFAADSPTQSKYPEAPKSDQVDDYPGAKVADPYRPLEDPDSAESRQWIEAENKITFDFLNTIPEREQIKKRLTEVWDFERFGVRSRRPIVTSFRKIAAFRTKTFFIARRIFPKNRANYLIQMC